MEKSKLRSKTIVSIGLILTLFVLMSVTAWASTNGGFRGRAETVSNDFSYNNNMDDDIKVIEPNWDPVERKVISPQKPVIKDPKIRNTSDYEGMAVIIVKMPTVMAKKSGDAVAKVYDVFEPSWNLSDYTLLYEKKSTVASVDSVYYFGLNKVLRVGEYSPYLFKKIRANNFIQASVSEDEIIIDAAITNAINPLTNSRYTNIREAFEIMGDYLPADYDTYKTNN